MKTPEMGVFFFEKRCDWNDTPQITTIDCFDGIGIFALVQQFGIYGLNFD
jgi:hypothetical protein